MPSSSLQARASAPFDRSPWLLGRWSAAFLAVVVAALAVAVGLLVPHAVPLSFLQEDGPVERGTIWVYLAAVGSVLLLRWRGMPVSDMLAACVLLLAMAAREADLHTAMFGISILKSRFYLNAPIGQILAALAVLLPIVASGLWLAVRHARQWLRPPASWGAPAATLAVLVASMVVAKVFDRTPDTLTQLHLQDYLTPTVRHVMLALEEILEFALPLFAMLAMLQGRWLARRGNVTK